MEKTNSKEFPSAKVNVTSSLLHLPLRSFQEWNDLSRKSHRKSRQSLRTKWLPAVVRSLDNQNVSRVELPKEKVCFRGSLPVGSLVWPTLGQSFHHANLPTHIMLHPNKPASQTGCDPRVLRRESSQVGHESYSKDPASVTSISMPRWQYKRQRPREEQEFSPLTPCLQPESWPMCQNKARKGISKRPSD